MDHAVTGKKHESAEETRKLTWQKLVNRLEWKMAGRKHSFIIHYACCKYERFLARCRLRHATAGFVKNFKQFAKESVNNERVSDKLSKWNYFRFFDVSCLFSRKCRRHLIFPENAQIVWLFVAGYFFVGSILSTRLRPNPLDLTMRYLIGHRGWSYFHRFIP